MFTVKMEKVPNLLCYLRIIAAPIIIFILLYESLIQNLFPFYLIKNTDFGLFISKNLDVANSFSILIGGVIFLLAMLTDAFDGKIARKYNAVSDKGKQLDPLADKILIIGTLFSFLMLDTPPDRALSIWAFSVILFREVLVTLLRMYSAKKGVIVAASIWGKIKTFSQTVAIVIAFIAYFVHFPIFGLLPIFLASFITLISLFPYLKTFYHILAKKA